MYNSLRRGLGFTPTKKIENLDKIYLTGNLSIENKEKIKKIKKSAKNIFNSKLVFLIFIKIKFIPLNIGYHI